ncbi:protein S100-A11 isoform X2 [Leopardus geoffroyi]|uniref:protein S100-A11 isoform X2 n=1 Tax=Leopardus geoffroyi TaxID=46844 RepID=UPI001E25F3E7|nr:protein S100-A11 isoform X2 [Leopardus geoffroyi]
MSSFAEESHRHQAHHTQDRHAEVLIRKSPESFRNRERRRVSGERRAGPRGRDRQVWICAGEGVWGRGWGWRPAGREPGSGVGRRRAGRDGQVRICARGAEAEAGPERWEPDPEPAPAFRSSQPAAAAAAQPQRPRPLRADMAKMSSPTETERCIESLIAVFQRYAGKDGNSCKLSKTEFLTFMNTELAAFTKPGTCTAEVEPPGLK